MLDSNGNRRNRVKLSLNVDPNKEEQEAHFVDEILIFNSSASAILGKDIYSDYDEAHKEQFKRMKKLPLYQHLSAASDVQPAQLLYPATQVPRKVPEVTVYFWIVKLFTTAIGESLSDALVNHINPFLAVALGGLGLLACLILQFTVRRYVPWIYWLAVVLVAIVGTMAADVVHIILGVSYLVSTVFFSAVLTAIFITWYASERTLSIHSITAGRREWFYWATIMATFALGTAAGDLTAATLGLGYLASGVLFAILLAIPSLAYWLFGLNEIVAFWFAYIVTRPLGASFADWFGKPSLGGLGLGDGSVTLVLTILIIGFVIYLTFTDRRSQHQ